MEMAGKTSPGAVAPRIWNYLKYRGLARRAVSPLRRYTPQIGCLLLTSRCNLNCGYCNAAKILREGRDDGRASEATLEKVKRIFANPLFANCLLADLAGGEPLLVKELDSIIAYFSEHGYITNTSTNGLILVDHIADLKRAGISRINVSVYEANRAVLERDLAKINRVFPVHASFVLLRSDVEKRSEKLLETVRFIREAGCCSLRFFMYRPMGLEPRPEEILTEDHPGFLEFRRRTEALFPGYCFWPKGVHLRGRKKLCPQLWQRTGCDMTGNIIICCGIDTVLEGPNSNLFENKPDVIFNHPTIVAMREKLLDPHSEPPEVCRTCNLLEEPGW